MMGETKPICDNCGEPRELCPDGICRTCHKSFTWDQCKAHKAYVMKRAGCTDEEIEKAYPGAVPRMAE